MADVSNSKINGRRNVERPNLGVTKIENKNWKNRFISKGTYENRKIASFAEYLMDEWKNLLIFGISIVFQIGKIRRIC